MTKQTAKALAQASKQIASWLEKRNRLIVDAVAAGDGVREVARAVGMNHTSVLHIVKREASS